MMSDKWYYCVLIVVSYAIYMICTWPNSPDGILLSGVIGAIALAGGFQIGKTRATSGIYVEEQPETTIEYPEEYS